MLEKKIESLVCKYAKEKGFLAYKFTSPACWAVPDRLFISPNGHVFFVEFKRKGQQPTAQQEREHQRLKEHRVHTFVIDDVDEGKRMVDWVIEACEAKDG